MGGWVGLRVGGWVDWRSGCVCGRGILWPENKSYAEQRRLQFDCDMQHMSRRSADGDCD